jgi:TPP-dependent pyruvate/acetoin dehydrogenase alpha subunit
VEAWLKRDPLILHRRQLTEDGLLDDATAERFSEEARASAKTAADRAAASAWPSADQDFMALTYV